MAKNPAPKKPRDRRCIYRCKDSKRVFRFPQDPDALKFWMDSLNIEKLTRCRSETYICNNHFSPSQLSVNGRKLTSTSIPDRNIPNKKDLAEPVFQGNKPEEFPNIVPSESDYHVIKPPVGGPFMNLAAIPRIVEKPTIITSEYSKCYLKCKVYETLSRFPPDLPSYNVWLKKLNFPEAIKVNRNRRTRIALCNNHFSPTMMGAKRISSCAVPDINLPSQCIFIDEFAVQATNSHENAEIIVPDYDDDCSQTAPIIIDEIDQPEILINPIENIKNVVNLPANKEGILHVFQPSINPTTTTDENDVILCPENNKKGKPECVLKCPNFKSLHRFPQLESKRQHWLTQVGLTHCFFNTRICDRHFSEKMFSHKRLTQSAFPDINLPEIARPRIRVASLPLQSPPFLELPQYISVLTVFKRHNEVEAVVHGTKYIEQKVNRKFPKREREIQVDMRKAFRKVDVAISADEDFEVEGLEIVKNINYDQKTNLINNNVLNSQVLAIKTKDLFECLKCGEILLDYDSNVKHLNSHTKLRCLCSHCGLMFSSKLNLKKHETKMHNIRFKRVVRCPKERCRKAFYSKKKLNHHLEEHFKPARYTCKKCGRLFFSSLKLHCHSIWCRPRTMRSRTKF